MARTCWRRAKSTTSHASYDHERAVIVDSQLSSLLGSYSVKKLPFMLFNSSTPRLHLSHLWSRTRFYRVFQLCLSPPPTPRFFSGDFYLTSFSPQIRLVSVRVLRCTLLQKMSGSMWSVQICGDWILPLRCRVKGGLLSHLSVWDLIRDWLLCHYSFLFQFRLAITHW